jgi:hypothetical protein
MGRSDRALRVVGRLLPSEFRQRVFEPALADLRLDEAGPGARSNHVLARIALVAESLRLGVPQFFWYRRRPTWLGMSLVGVAVIALIAAQRLNYGRR